MSNDLDDDAHVLVRIFFFKVFPNLSRHIAFPKVQNLPLVTRKRLQHYVQIVTAIQNFLQLT